MKKIVIGNAGTKGAHTSFLFPLFVDSTSTFIQFRAAICDRFPWGIYDVVEFMYQNSESVVWVPVQRGDEQAIIFGIHADIKFVQLETNVM